MYASPCASRLNYDRIHWRKQKTEEVEEPGPFLAIAVAPALTASQITKWKKNLGVNILGKFFFSSPEDVEKVQDAEECCCCGCCYHRRGVHLLTELSNCQIQLEFCCRPVVPISNYLTEYY